jgi:hypothetical protein
MATSKKVSRKKASAKKAPAKKKATKASTRPKASTTADAAALLKKIDLQLGSKRIKFSAKDIEMAAACLKRTGRIKISFRGGVIAEPPDGGTPPGPID